MMLINTTEKKKKNPDNNFHMLLKTQTCSWNALFQLWVPCSLRYSNREKINLQVVGSQLFFSVQHVLHKGV